jgi:hypothetical protein
MVYNQIINRCCFLMSVRTSQVHCVAKSRTSFEALRRQSTWLPLDLILNGLLCTLYNHSLIRAIIQCTYIVCTSLYSVMLRVQQHFYPLLHLSILSILSILYSSSHKFKHKLYNFLNRGLIWHFNCNCILCLTNLKIAKEVPETRRCLLCNKITFTCSSALFGILKVIIGFFYLLCDAVKGRIF